MVHRLTRKVNYSLLSSDGKPLFTLCGNIAYMKNISDRIHHLRKAAGMTQEQVADMTGVSKVTISKWERGMELSLSNAASLCRALGVSLDDLFYGETLGDSVSCRQIPIVGTTQAGPSREWFDLGFPAGWSDEYVDFPAKSPNTYALRVVGDSMAPRILEGEAVLIDPNIEPVTGEEVVVKLTTGDVMVKTLAAVRDGLVFLDSYNNGYARIVKPTSEIKFMHSVIGVARSSRIKISV